MREISLRQFLDNEYGGTREQFAAEIKSTAASLSRYERGGRIPNRETMRRIHEISGGKVTANSFYGLTPSRSGGLTGRTP